MPNLLTNAAFLDETTGWAATAQLTLSVDESTRGAPGRAVLTGAGTASGGGQVLTIEPSAGKRPAVVPGDVVEAQIWLAATVAGAVAAPSASVVFRSSGGTVLATHALNLQEPASQARGEALRGDRATFRRGYGRFTAPESAATATIKADVAAGGGEAAVLAVLKPLLAVVPGGRTLPLVWDPGVHDNADLQLPRWPSDLRPFQAGPGAEPRPATAEFDAGAQRPSQRRTSADPARRFNGRIRCDGVERDILEQFWRATGGDFWFLEPDSDRLCVASFASDGAPRMTETRGPTCMMDLGLWLETA